MPKARAVDVWANYWPSEFFANYRPLGEVYDKGVAVTLIVAVPCHH